MAYAAATCLKNTILRLLYHPSISLVPPSRETIEIVHAEAQSLQLLLEKLDESSKSRSRKTVNALDAQIREAVSEFDDILESRVTDQLLSQSDQKRNRDEILFFINLLDLKQDIHSFTERVRQLKTEYTTALENMPEDDDDDDCFDGNKSHMVGLCDQFRNLKDWVTGTYPRELSLSKIIGMGGIGKTNLAKQIFEDPDVSRIFHYRAWVKVGRKCQIKDILRAIIPQVNYYSAHIHAEKDEDIAHYLKQSLKGCTFLIVLDDVWDVGVWRDLLSLIPDDYNGSRVLLTTRSTLGGYSQTLIMRFLTKEESWDLLREKVFAQELCPRQLEKAGKKIAEKCDGLPLTIITIAKLLSKAETTPEYWNEVAENRNSVFTDAYNEISKVLYPSYDYLPQHLKMCFICTGVLPQRYVIPRYKLINMWIVEEFLKETKESNYYLYELEQNTLVMVYQWSSTRYPRIKTCGVHSSLWHLCNIEARKNKYFHVLISRKDGLSEDIKGQRRLCIHNNVLFAIKDVYTSLEDDCATTVRSLGCFGTYHPYQVPITFGLRLLSLLDALTIRFYEFPMEVLKLVQLRYLALTCNGNLPASISKLWNLRFLIVRPHLRTIKSYGAPSYLPVEIWDMKQLKHLHIIGYDLPDPKNGSFFPNMSSLLDVSGDTCTKGVLSRIFNLRKLVLRIELKPDVDEPLSCFAHVSCLKKLKIFKCIIVNPAHKAEIFTSPAPLPDFSSSIKKLTLSGLGYPWEKISKIASLPKLQVLKLRNCAFRGPKWEVKDNEFKRLKFLAIEDTDLVQWKVGCKSFSMLLHRMSFKHCYKLQEIHWGPSTFLPISVQVVDCNLLVLTSLEQIKISTHCHHVTFDSHSTWVDGELNDQVLLPELDKTSKSRSRKRVNALDGEIREAVSKFEDVLESRVTDQLLSQSPSDPQERNGDSWIQFSIDLLDLKQDTQSFTRRVKELKIAYRKALMNMPEDDEDAVVSSAINFGGKKTKMVGFSDRYGKLKLWVVGAFRHQFSFIVIIGMGGIGKTTLANKIFEDPDVTSHYHCRAWVTVGRKYELKDMLQAIIAQVNCQSDQILAERDEDIAQLLKESLKGRRFLIVLDDVWDKGVWPDLESLIPDDKNGSQVLLTTRSKLVAQSQLSLKMRLLTKEESWDLLREKVFAEDSCPRQLEKVGKKIAEKCDGLPLTILAIAEILSTAEMTPQYWDEVAENRNSIFMDAYNEISKVLYPSYDYLPQYLKMCFICTGVFPQKYVIPRSKLINIWIAEEFLKETKESYVAGYLQQLVYNTLLMVYQKTSSGYPSIKTCGVHSSLWHLCSMEARKNKSFHVLSTLKDALSEDINSQRRLCIHNNVLFGIKDAYNSLEDVCAATVRSLGCFGPYHPYQVPITFGLRLLRLLDALTIRFYEFPMEVLKLVQLRYLALTYNGNLPASISKLWNLRFLIVHPHLRLINSYQAPSYLPMEIWDMKELKHLQITGSDLPDPSSDTFLPNLSTLLDVSERTCTRGVLERIPNLKKLGIQIELRPDGTDEPALTCFAHISCLQKLKRLKCIVINPEQRADIFASLSTHLPNFPLGIRRLTLSGLGYPWKEMSNIALLPKLEVLKLQNYAFRGPKWEIEENVFKELRTLAIEDTDLVQWKVGRKSFGIFINHISFKHCYNLKEIHWGPSMLPIELQVVDCNPLGLTCFRQIQINTYSSYIRFDAHSSWIDGELNNLAMVYPWDI